MSSLKNVLESLSKKRPVFHSEADFQHALAWEFATLYPNLNIRLEYNPQVFENRSYIDIWLRDESGRNIAIELKYKTKETIVKSQDEVFNLARHGAPANNRFLYVQDVHRVEHVVQRCPNTVGYALLLTNDNEYWKPWKEKDTKDKQFRIQEGRILSGELKWKDDTAQSTKDKMGDSLVIMGSYDLKWSEYSTVVSESGKDGNFRYLLVQVK